MPEAFSSSAVMSRSTGESASGAMAPRPAGGLLRFLDWFVPNAWLGTPTLRQRFHVFVASHFVGVLLGGSLFVALYEAAPPSGALLRWLVPPLALFLLLPLGLRLSGRLDILGAISSQLFAFTVLLGAHAFGGLESPALLWVVLAIGTTIYYLAPWPRWRNANLVAQIVQLAVFLGIERAAVWPSAPVSAEILLSASLFTGAAVTTMISLISFQIWSMHVDQRRELEREIVERRAAEADRAQSETELRLSRDHLNHSQRVGRIGSSEIVYRPLHRVRWSDALFELMERDPALGPLQPEEFVSTVHPDDRALLRMRREREARGDYPRASEFRVMLPGGRIRWIRRAAEPIEWNDALPARAIATYLDVTEQKDAERAVADLEEQLSQAHKMEAVGQLTGGVAHDFNNLLAVLLGRLQMIDDALLDPRPEDAAELRDWVQSCIRAVNRGASLTKSMMAFSRQQALTPAIIDANAVVADMGDMLHRVLGETHELLPVKAPDLWKTEVDAGQLQNALLNLVLNARDAMPGGGAIVIETRNTRLDAGYVAHNLDVAIGEYVELSVTDKGTGMPSEVLKRAFEPFFTTKEVGKGSGLGLSMVYGFVKQSGGHVAIESEPWRGTTVRIFLPRKDGAATRTPAAVKGVTRGGNPGTVLLVEDNEDLRAVTRHQIERMGYSVIDVADAAAGFDQLRAHPEIRLLVSDLGLPRGVNGLELAETAVARHPHLRVVLISGYNEEHVAFKRARGRFPFGLLQKPFQPTELAALIQTALGPR